MTRPAIPTKTELSLLEPYQGVSLAQIVLPKSSTELAEALHHLSAQRVVGFDTESRPTFKVGEDSGGPHLLQFATAERVYLFQLDSEAAIQAVRQLLGDEHIIKAGFGLKSDRSKIRQRLGMQVAAILDLNDVFRARGYNKEIGVRMAVAVLFRQRFAKSKSVTTSNWASKLLNDRQKLYAANDAYAALQVFHQLGLPEQAWVEFLD